MFKRKKSSNDFWKQTRRVIAINPDNTLAYYSPSCCGNEQKARIQAEQLFPDIEWYFEDDGTMNGRAVLNNQPVIVKIVWDYPAK